MRSTTHPLTWSFPCIPCRGVQIRLSLLFILVWMGLGFAYGFTTGFAAGVILTASVFLREFVRGGLIGRAALRQQGPLILWPAGSLSLGAPPASPWGMGVWEAMSGALTNLAVCFLVYPLLYHSSYHNVIWNIEELPKPGWNQPGLDLAALVFSLNWKLFVANVFPMRSLDAGRACEVFFVPHWGNLRAMDLCLKISAVTGVLTAVSAFSAQCSWMVVLSMFLLIVTFVEMERFQTREEKHEETFLGYDFSEGYTSLERATPEPHTATAAQPGLMARWLEHRRQQKIHSEEELLRREAQLVDEILEKLHQQGMESLSPHEKHLLSQASVRMREKIRSPRK